MIKYFRDIKTPALRAYNQIQECTHIMDTHGEEAAKAYYEGLDKNELFNFKVVATRIQSKGSDFVKKEIMNMNIK